MALRLAAIADADGAADTDSPPSTAPVAAAADPADAVRALIARGSATTSAGDAAGWRGVFARTAELDDVHLRHYARRLLAQQALAARGTSVVQLGPRYAAVADALLNVLEAEPREPLLLNLAGIACYELGAIAAAEPLFAAALRLDPQLSTAAGNLDECRRRRRAGLTSPAPLPPAVLARLRPLTTRAKRVALAARPATGLTLSLCMIVRDEEAMLGRCLAAVAGAVDEIVIVDTGSVDGTVAIAESFGAQVLHHEWTGDFGAARNVSFDAATGDWLLYLDADEVLVAEDAGRLRALTGRVWHEAMYLVETNHTGDLDDGTAVTHDALRLFRNRPEYRFEGRIHEQIAQHLPGFLPERLARTDVRIEHFGYLGVVRDDKGKSRRNIELLEQQVAEGDDSPFLHFNLASELSAAGDAVSALPHFTRAWAALRDDPRLATYGFAPALATRLVRTQRVAGAHAELDRTVADVLERFPGLTDVVFEQAHAARLRGDLETASVLLETCLEMGDAPSRYSPTVGCGSHLARVTLGEVAFELGDLPRAELLLRDALALAPAYLGTVEVLARVLRARGADGPAVAAVIHDGVAASTPSVRFLLAVALYETGAWRDAELELRAVLDAQPSAAWARVALAEALLSQGRTAEAAAAAAVVPDDAPAKGAALRTEAFALLADAEHDTAIAGLGTPAAIAALPAAERAALLAWAGDPSVGTVPAAAAPIVGVMLDALARLERFDAFEALVAVLHRIPIGVRERHEQLATIYLRRGFLDSATDEWIAVVEELGADAAALRGLSRVAAARGLDADAALLAADAAALDLEQTAITPLKSADPGPTIRTVATAPGPRMGRPPVQEDPP
ncbi:beta-1,4-glycosyltransferase [Paraconexibacter sp. AEG42_29]|uniref:Beta-1,4-glycosyltransferase n=1 Tax=Paraconexibacter sp. AEG42_29 TaxID=2997339 RepID=A0AAU7ANK9_9ACTN